MFFSEANESWLVVHRNNAPNSEKCFDPSFMNIISQFKPMVKKLKDGTSEITFAR